MPGQSVPEVCMAGTFQSHGGVALLVTIVGVAAAAICLAKGVQWLREDAECRRQNLSVTSHYAAKGWLLGLWLLVPPAWLYVEDIFLFRHFGKAACFDQFRYAQQIVMHGWTVFVAVLALVYFGREIAGRD
ncbi:hypothetical protein [Edaphobacter sp. 12200R-103]|jgi:hypothetical protein|uniref:hypothetical protein n=1 Tax=Edaphobacter sp. 12200R-103 TaxID=2703788 RepID=UPI00138CFE60|nr:hypothetical protein [Edaphobacter sp. 12200R-103]QHS52836.1 hypothetical protein GWR55_14735 [Edaphobacter sp. 12200R-103]